MNPGQGAPTSHGLLGSPQLTLEPMGLTTPPRIAEEDRKKNRHLSNPQTHPGGPRLWGPWKGGPWKVRPCSRCPGASL